MPRIPSSEERSRWVVLPVRRIQPAALMLQLAVESHGCYIAGGYARWACSRYDDTPPAKDIDIICPDERKLAGLHGHFVSSGYKCVREGTFSRTYTTPAIDKEIQLLKPYVGPSLEACLDQFDLSICRIGLVSHDSALADRQFVVDDTERKVSVCQAKEGTALNTMQRLVRYARKGFDVNPADVIYLTKVLQSKEEKQASKAVEASHANHLQYKPDWGLS